MKKFCMLIGMITIMLLSTSCDSTAEREKISLGVVGFCDELLKSGEAISQMWTEMGIDCAIEHTAGSIDSASRIESGKLDSAVISQSVCYRSLLSDPEQSKIRAAFILSKRYAQAWTIRKDVLNYLDFEDKIICVGPEGGNGKEFLEMILSALGVKPRKMIYGDYNDANDILISGRADVMFGCLEAPNCFVTSAMASVGAHLVFLSDAQIDIVINHVPLLLKFHMPTTAYGEAYKDVSAIGDFQVYCFTRDVPEKLVYAFVKSLFDKRRVLDMYLADYNDLGPEYIDDLIVPLHLGAYRYYVEKGLWIPEYAHPIDQIHREDIAGQSSQDER